MNKNLYELDIEQRAQLMEFMFGWAMAQNDEIPQKSFFDRLEMHKNF